MDSIFRGDLASRAGRRNAWLDSLFVDHALLRLAWSNFAVVVPGVLYRCNHPTPGRLARLARRLGLRTVLNLRGATGNGSDALSRAAAGRLGLAFVDLPMRSGAAPSRAQLLALIAALEGAAAPVLVHCKSGADRAGFAAAVFLLLQGETVERARGQLSWRFGHLRRGRAGVLGAVLDAFARDEGARGFHGWVRERYEPDGIARIFRAGRLAGWVNARLLRRE